MGPAIVDTLPALHVITRPDTAEAAAFASVIDAVAWGAAVALAQAAVPIPVACPVGQAVVTHVLALRDFDGAYAAQAAMFDLHVGVKAITITNSRDKDRSALIERAGATTTTTFAGDAVLLVASACVRTRRLGRSRCRSWRVLRVRGRGSRRRPRQRTRAGAALQLRR